MTDSYLAMVMAGKGVAPAPVERRIPEPAAGEAVVRVRASSMNYHDLVNLMGLIDGPWPRVPMTDGAGTVVAIGSGVTTLAVGDRVFGAFHPAWADGPPVPATKPPVPGDTCDGWLEQYHAYPASALIPTPDHLDDAEAATLPCAGVTAWSSLAAAGIGADDVVLAQGTGGVSLFAVQLAKARGATVILTSSSDEKLEVGARLGADHLVNYRTTPEWHREVKALTDGRGADLVVDVGGQDTLARSVRATRMGGTVAIVGVLGGFGNAELPVSTAMTQNIHLVGITVGSVQAHRDLAATIAEAGFRPHVSHRLGWDEVPEAMRVMQAGEHIGKITVSVP